MKSQFIHKRINRIAVFMDLEPGDWFLYDDDIHIKASDLPKSDLVDYNAICFDKDMKPRLVEISKDEVVLNVGLIMVY